MYHKLEDDINKENENTFKNLFNRYYIIIKNKCMLI